MAADGSVIIEIIGNADDITRDLQNVAENATKAGAAAKLAVAGLSASLLAVAKSAVDVGAQFDTSMSQVAATMGLSVEEIQNGSAEFEVLSAAAKEAGASTAFSASQAAEALNYLALAGYDAATSAEVLPSVLNLAAAGGMDLAYASDLATDAMAALGIEASKANLERFGDQLAAAASHANASVAQLGEAILVVGGTAKSLAGGTTELNAALGVLANRGIKGAEGGTALRNIILSLSAPTDKAAKLMEELGVAVYDAEGKMRPLNETFKDLDAAMQGMTEGEKTNVLNEIFNKVDLKSAQALLAGTGEEFDSLAAAINNSAGAMENMAETQLDNLAGDMTKFQSASEAAGIALSSSLIPSLREVVQAGTSVMSFAGNALDKFPALGSVFAGVATGAATLTAGMGAMAAASAITGGAVTTLTGAVAALGTAIVASPIAPFALAVGGLVGVFTAVRAATNDATDANKEFLTSLEETKEALSENAEEAKITGENIRAQAEAILKLAEAEKLTGVEQKALLNMIQELNAAVPGLNLAYDEQTGKLNMTADAVRNLTAAEGERLVQNEGAQAYSQLLAQQTEIALQMEQAEVELAEARAKNAAAQTEEIVNGQKVIKLNSDLASAQSEAALKVGKLRSQYDALQAAMDEIVAEYGDVITKTDDVSSAISDAGDTAQELTVDFDELTKASIAASDSVDLMADALTEQEKEGSLSLKTINELTEAGYAAAIAVNEETGAVELNRDEYVKLAAAKIQEQIATLESSKANLESKKALDEASEAAARTGGAYWDAAKGALALKYAEDSKPIDLQIAALKRSMDALNSYGNSSTSAARKSSAASKKIKTQAEKDLEEYKALKAELDHQRTMDEVSEEEYYSKLSNLRDQYLSDKANISEYRKASEELHKIDEQNLEAEKKVYEEREKLRDKFSQSALEAAEQVLALENNYQKELNDRTREIASSYKLFDEVPERQKVSGNELLKNLEAQNKSIEAFYSNLDKLAERQGSAALVEEIRSMGVGAQDQLAALLNMTDEKLQEYAVAYEEKQRMANELATKELEGLRTVTDEKIQEQIDSVQALYDENASVLGFEFTEGIAEGIRSGIVDAVSAAIEMAQAVADATRSTLDEHSPSKVGNEIGQMFDAGIAEGVDDGTRDVLKSASNMADEMSDALKNNLLGDIDISDITKQLRTAVEAEAARLSANLTISSNAPIEARAARDTRMAAQTAAANVSYGGNRSNETLVVRIGAKEFYRGTLEDLRQAEDETPRTVDDT